MIERDGMTIRTCQQQLEDEGYTMICTALNADRTARLLAALEDAMQRPTSHLISADGRVTGARNVQDWFPEVVEYADQTILTEFLQRVLGNGCGLVRVLFFDKPPGQGWSLPWHKDRTIAVQDNRLPSHSFCRPTVKAGVPHVEAPVSVLNQMLTLRLHLDPVTSANGPLHLIPGSHRQHGEPLGDLQAIHAEQGDVLAMRPLVTHSSPAPLPGSGHRRILHFEYAASHELPDGYTWHRFQPLLTPFVPAKKEAG